MLKTFISFVLAFLLFGNTTFAFEDSELIIHGFVSTGYMKSNHNNFLLSSKEGSFEFNEFGINFNTKVTDNIRVGAQLYSFDMGDIGNNEIILDWAFLDYHQKEEISVRLGKIKTPFGLYTEVRDYDMLRTCILLPQGVYNQYYREAIVGLEGVDLYGKIPLGSAGLLGYDAFIGSMNLSSGGGIEKVATRFEQGWDLLSMRMDYSAGARLQWYTPIKGLKTAFSFLTFDIVTTHALNTPVGTTKILMDIPGGHYSLSSIEYTFKNLTAAAEYLSADQGATLYFDMSELSVLPPGQDPLTKIKADHETESYYAMISYRFSKLFEAGAYYSVYYDNKDDRDGDDLVALGKNDYEAWQKDITISALFNINEWWIVKLETHFINGVASTLGVDNPDGYDNEDSVLYAIKTTFNF